jgi:putative membrane protein
MMNRPASSLVRLFLLVLLPLAACTGAERAAGNAATEGQAMMQAETNPTLSTGDAYFLDQATRRGLAEVVAAQLAERRAARADVRTFAARVASDHAKVNESLNALARQKQIFPPTTPSDAERQEMSRLEGLRGAAFDQQFLDQQVAMHQRAVSLYRQESQQGTDPDVKSFAAHMLPLLEEQLAEAERLGGRAPAI